MKLLTPAVTASRLVAFACIVSVLVGVYGVVPINALQFSPQFYLQAQILPSEKRDFSEAFKLYNNLKPVLGRTNVVFSRAEFFPPDVLISLGRRTGILIWTHKATNSLFYQVFVSKDGQLLYRPYGSMARDQSPGLFGIHLGADLPQQYRKYAARRRKYLVYRNHPFKICLTTNTPNANDDVVIRVAKAPVRAGETCNVVLLMVEYYNTDEPAQHPQEAVTNLHQAISTLDGQIGENELDPNPLSRPLSVQKSASYNDIWNAVNRKKTKNWNSAPLSASASHSSIEEFPNSLTSLRGGKSQINKPRIEFTTSSSQSLASSSYDHGSQHESGNYYPIHAGAHNRDVTKPYHLLSDSHGSSSFPSQTGNFDPNILISRLAKLEVDNILTRQQLLQLIERVDRPEMFGIIENANSYPNIDHLSLPSPTYPQSSGSRSLLSNTPDLGSSSSSMVSSNSYDINPAYDLPISPPAKSKSTNKLVDIFRNFRRTFLKTDGNSKTTGRRGSEPAVNPNAPLYSDVFSHVAEGNQNMHHVRGSIHSQIPPQYLGRQPPLNPAAAAYFFPCE